MLDHSGDQFFSQVCVEAEVTEQWMSFGPELRRMRVAADLSLTRLAGLLHYSKGHVSKVETGLKRPTPELAQRCDTLLGAEGALSALVPARSSGSVAGEAMTRWATDVSEVWSMNVAPDGTSWFRLVDRRQVLVAGAASVLGFGFSDRHVSVAARQSGSLEGFRALFDQFRQLGQTASPAVVLPALIAQTQTGARTRRPPGGTDRDRRPPESQDRLRAGDRLHRARAGRPHRGDRSMTTEEKTLLAVLTIAAVLVPVVLGAALGWPQWLWPLLAVPLLGVLGRVARNIQRRVQEERLWQPHVTPPVQVEQPDQSLHTPVGGTLPSAVAGYDFHFSATAYWRPARGSRKQHANFGALAAGAIVVRAQTITAGEQPNKVEAVQYRLASALGAVERDASGGVEAWADHVQLTLSEADQERLRKRSEGDKDKDLWEHEYDYESRKRAYFRDDVLKSTGSAVIWWLVQKDNDVEDTVRLIGALAQLSAAANDAEVQELFRHLVPTPATPGQLPFESIDGDQRFPNGACHDGSRQTIGFPWAGLPPGPFLDVKPVVSHSGALMDTLDLGDEKRALFARRLALLIEKTGKPDEAHEIQRHFDAPATDEEPADLPELDGDLPDRPASDMEPTLQGGPQRNFPLLGESEQDRQLQADEQLRSEQLDEPRD